MPELHLQRTDSILTVTLGEQSASIPFADVVPNASTWQHIYDDAAAYGRDLFDKTYRYEQMRTMLTNMPTNERLVLIADDHLVGIRPPPCQVP